eukprot:jgi/Chlat1/2050/Chrsp17S02524
MTAVDSRGRSDSTAAHFIAVVEADLRSLAAEAKRKHPEVKDAAEKGIAKLRATTVQNGLPVVDEALRCYLLCCSKRDTKLSIHGLACLQRLAAHDAVEAAALPPIIATLRQHADVQDEDVQLKVLQTVLTLFQSSVHPTEEASMTCESVALVLSICLRLLSNARSADSVHRTAVSTIRQAAALMFERTVAAEGLTNATAFTGDPRPSHTVYARSALFFFEDLCTLAGGGQASWLRVQGMSRALAFDMIEYMLSHYPVLFRQLLQFQQVLKKKVCSLLMNSMRAEGAGDVGEPAVRRQVLKTVGAVMRYFCRIITTECEVFVTMLLKSLDPQTDVPLWHRAYVLEVIRAFATDVRVIRVFYDTFDLRPKTTNVVADVVVAAARVVHLLQQPSETSEEVMLAMERMFKGSAKGVDASLVDSEQSGSGNYSVAGEAYVVCLAVECLLGVITAISTLTDCAVEGKGLPSPTFAATVVPDAVANPELDGLPVTDGLWQSSEDGAMLPQDRSLQICAQMVESVWRTELDALAFLLSKTTSEALLLALLKGYSCFTQACGLLQIVHPRDAWLASLCRFTLVNPTTGVSSVDKGDKRPSDADSREAVMLNPTNIHALRTLFNVAHRLDDLLGPSWALVLETLAALDRVLASPHAATQEAGSTRRPDGQAVGRQSSEITILSTLTSQLFESTAMMSNDAVLHLVKALVDVSNLLIKPSGRDSFLSGAGTNTASQLGATMAIGGGAATANGPALKEQVPRLFAVERLVDTLLVNLHRVESFWDVIAVHLVDVAQHQHSGVRCVAMHALNRCITAILSEDRILARHAVSPGATSKASLLAFVSKGNQDSSTEPFECIVLEPLLALQNSSKVDTRLAALRVLLQILQKRGDVLTAGYRPILQLLRSVASQNEDSTLQLAFQSVQLVVNDCLANVPASCLQLCVDMAMTYGAQQIDLNISLTAIGSLWSMADYYGKGLLPNSAGTRAAHTESNDATLSREHSDEQLLSRNQSMDNLTRATSIDKHVVESLPLVSEVDEYLLPMFVALKALCTDHRPEVRNSAVRTLTAAIVSHGGRLSVTLWRSCLYDILLPLCDTVRHLAATSSADENVGKELGREKGRAVMMLVHHSRNSEQKQWDETVVLALKGIAKLLRTYFALLLSIDGFDMAWASIINFMEHSASRGSKEVCSAAVQSLQVAVQAHLGCGVMPRSYWLVVQKSLLAVVQACTQPQCVVPCKTRVDIVNNLKELYLDCRHVLEAEDVQLLFVLLNEFACNPTAELDQPVHPKGSLPPVQKAVLEVLAVVVPLESRHTELWPGLLRQLLSYQATSAPSASSTPEPSPGPRAQHLQTSNGHVDNTTTVKYFALEFAQRAGELFSGCYGNGPPPRVQAMVFTDAVLALKRAMLTRRENPEAHLWRTAVAAFKSIIPVGLNALRERAQVDSIDVKLVWQALSAAFQEFMLTATRRLPSCPAGFLKQSESVPLTAISTQLAAEDEELEISMLDLLVDDVLIACSEAPPQVRSCLVQLIDICTERPRLLPQSPGSRAGPSRSNHPEISERFAQACLRKLFQLCRRGGSGEGAQQVCMLDIACITLPILLARCVTILQAWVDDERESGGFLLPRVRLDEMTAMLEELCELTLHPQLAARAHLQDARELQSVAPSTAATGVADLKGSSMQRRPRTHLLTLYAPLVEVIGCREPAVNELLRHALKLTGEEVGLLEGVNVAEYVLHT